MAEELQAPLPFLEVPSFKFLVFRQRQEGTGKEIEFDSSFKQPVPVILFNWRRMENPAQYDIFLCHNGADKDWVENLGARLEAESIDGTKDGRRIRVFFDKWDIEGGENVVKKLGEALNKSKFVAVIMSPEFFSSGWTAFEWTDVVAGDPSGRLGRLVPIYLREISLDGRERISFPAPFKALHRYDFRKENAFEREFEKVLRKIRGQAPSRGIALPARYSMGIPPKDSPESVDSWSPDRLTDALLGNLLEVRGLPTQIWSGVTSETKPTGVWKKVPNGAPFILRSNRLWTFADLTVRTEPLRQVIKAETITTETRAAWLFDSDKSIWLMDLLNKSLASHLSKLAMKRDKKGRFFFRPDRNEAGTEINRLWQNGNDRPREVAAKKKNDRTKATFWVHHAATVKFRRFGSKFFLSIEPTYVFTTNGETLLEGDLMGKLVVMWGGRQRNPDILRNLVFWSKAIARSAKEFSISTGGEPIVVSGLPATALLNVGIEADHVRVGSLLNTADNELEEAAQDVEVIPEDELEEEEGEDEEE